MPRPETTRTLTQLTLACDAVYGSTSIVLASLATWQAILGNVGPGIVIALWLVPGSNLMWSFAMRWLRHAHINIGRAVTSLPLVTYIYRAEPGTVFADLWLPALMVGVGASLALGIETRRLRSGAIVAVVYAAAIALGGRETDIALHDAFGVWLGIAVLSIVAVYLGRTLDDLAAQRDEAQAEMKRRMQLEVELAHAQKLESVGRLAAGVAHEINTPVQFVGDSLKFVREGLDDLLGRAKTEAPEDEEVEYLVEKLPKALDRAEDGLSRVAKIVRSMKVFAHLDTDTMVPTDLNRAVEATVVLAHNEYRYVADLDLELDAELPLVECYAGELNQVILNIVVNAAHAIGDRVRDEEGSKGRIHVRTYRDGDDAVISVGDTGTGIPDSVRSKIFDPFFTTKEVGRGTGQGLAIARAVIGKHGGKLTFDTELGRGTTFHIRLPLERATAQAA